jgi:chromosome segregation ATPase
MNTNSTKVAIASALVLASLTIGCVSKKDYESVQQQLATCESDKKAAQDSASGFERRLDSDKERWESLNTSLGAVLPQVQADLETQRKEIIKLVPEQVRGEVGARLDRHFSSIASQLTTVGKQMQEEVEGLKTQLTAAQAQITELRSQTTVVETKVDATHEAVTGDNHKLEQRLADQGKRAQDLTAQITQFDTTYLTCADCPEKLKMKDTSREALLKLHADLLKALSSLQASTGSAG